MRWRASGRQPADSIARAMPSPLLAADLEGEPVAIQRDPQGISVGTRVQLGDRIGRVRTMQHAVGQCFERRLRDPAAMCTHQRREEPLLVLREAGDVRVREHVGAMHLVLAVRDGQAELVQPGSPAQHRAVVRAELPGAGDLVEQAQRRRLHARGLRGVDAVADHQRIHRCIARIVVADAADQVVQHALAQRRAADHHPLQPQRVEGRFQDEQPAGDERPPILRQAGQVDGVDVPGAEQPVAHDRQLYGGDSRDRE